MTVSKESAENFAVCRYSRLFGSERGVEGEVGRADDAIEGSANRCSCWRFGTAGAGLAAP
jgi:hypothetical protein